MMVIALGNIIISSNLDYIGSKNSKYRLSYPVRLYLAQVRTGEIHLD